MVHFVRCFMSWFYIRFSKYSVHHGMKSRSAIWLTFQCLHCKNFHLNKVSPCCNQWRPKHCRQGAQGGCQMCFPVDTCLYADISTVDTCWGNLKCYKTPGYISGICWYLCILQQYPATALPIGCGWCRVDMPAKECVTGVELQWPCIPCGRDSWAL